MSFPFDEILIESCADRYAFEDAPRGDFRLAPLSKVNVFVGANNSGKSRLMRALAATENVRALQKPAVRPGISSGYIRDRFELLRSEVVETLDLYQCPDVNSIRGTLGKLALHQPHH